MLLGDAAGEVAFFMTLATGLGLSACVAALALRAPAAMDESSDHG